MAGDGCEQGAAVVGVWGVDEVAGEQDGVEALGQVEVLDAAGQGGGAVDMGEHV